MSEVSWNLDSLPDLPLEKITSYLPFSDQVQLSASSPSLAHLQPRLQEVHGEDFDKNGPNDGDFHTETYVDVPILTRGIKSVTMEWQWRDQGYGNQKGQVWILLYSLSYLLLQVPGSILPSAFNVLSQVPFIFQVWLQLVREGVVVGDARSAYPALAPHMEGSRGRGRGAQESLERRQVEVVGHPVVLEARRGDVLRVARNVGGGGGHRLVVRGFKMVIHHRKEVEEEGWDV